MSYTLNVEPDLMHKVESYALRNGTTLDAMIRACMLVIVSQGQAASDFPSQALDSHRSACRKLHIGSMRDEIKLPTDFDQKFENLDSDVAAMFNEVS